MCIWGINFRILIFPFQQKHMVNKGEVRKEASMRPEIHFLCVAQVTNANSTMSKSKAERRRDLT